MCTEVYTVVQEALSVHNTSVQSFLDPVTMGICPKNPFDHGSLSETRDIKKEPDDIDNKFDDAIAAKLKCSQKHIIIPLAPVGVLAPVSAHAGPSAQPPIGPSGYFSACVSAESPSNIPHNPSEVISEVSEVYNDF